MFFGNNYRKRVRVENIGSRVRVNSGPVAARTRSKTKSKYLSKEEIHYNGLKDEGIDNDNILWNGIPAPYILKTVKNDNDECIWNLLEFDDDDDVFNLGEDDNLYKFLNRGAEGMAYVNSTQTKIVKIITDTTYANER